MAVRAAPTEAAVERLRFFLRAGVQGGSCGPAGTGSAARRCGGASRNGVPRPCCAGCTPPSFGWCGSGPQAAAAAWDVGADSCGVRARRGGGLTGPSPTDRARRGAKYHAVVASDGIPLAALPSAADVPDARLFPGLSRRALVVCAAIARLCADAACHSAGNRRLCAAEGILPPIRESGQPHGSGPGAVRCVVEHANAWLLADKRLDRRHDRSTNIIDALLTTACIFLIANRLTD